ncbi:MAG: Mrp/NBP35 family ATP-binding protein [Neisseriaceae bacterium]
MNREELIKAELNLLPIPDSDWLLGDLPYTFQLFSKGAEKDKLQIELPVPYKLYETKLLTSFQKALSPHFLGEDITFTSNIRAKRVRPGLKPIPQVKNLLAVASGKGGVGKSSVAANLAWNLQLLGAEVGLLDADIYGPSQSLMMGFNQHKAQQSSGHFIPAVHPSGIKVMSMGFLIEENQSLVWRGPMISKALLQLLFQTDWGNLDYLIIDLPPGTGDIQLTLAQKIPVTAALIVTTPQKIALIDAEKAIQMFQKVSIPVIGIAENMSYHVCSHCGTSETILGSGGGQHLAKKTNIPLLGQIPLTQEICEAMDKGKFELIPKQLDNFQAITWKAALALSRLANDFSSRLPEVAIEKTKL